MQCTFTVYDGASEVLLQSASPFQTITALSSLNRHLFVVNERNELLAGYVEIGANHVELRLLKSNTVDVQCSRSDQRLYTIDTSGSVHQLAITKPNCQNPTPEWSELVVPNPRKCPHGVKSTSEKVRIAALNSNCDGVLFTSISGELFGMGNFGEVLRSSSPVPVECFSGIKVLQVTAGDHFVVVLTQQKVGTTSAAESSSSHSDGSGVVYLNTECSKCAPEEVRRRLEVPTTTNGSTTDTSVASSGSQSDVFELDEVWPPPGKSANDPSTGPLRSHKETALNFLLDTLSISGEDAGKQTQLLKANVSNITSLVREGVRTLSRHMSGSDSNEVTDVDEPDSEIELPNHDDDDNAFEQSARTDVSTDEGDSSMISALELPSECETEAEIMKLCRVGETALGTTVWCFGTVNKGHLGTGDHIRRTRISEALGLSGQGVLSISSGSEHSAAVTLDGRLYLWGSNGDQQIFTEDVEDVPSPRRYRNGKNVWTAVCGHRSTSIILNTLQIREIRKGTNNVNRMFYKTEQSIDPARLVLASNEFMVQNHCPVGVASIEPHLSVEQRHLQDTLRTFQTVIKPMLKRLNFTTKNPHTEDLCQLYLNLIHLTAATVRSLRSYFRGRIACPELMLLVNSRELIAAYRRYMHRLCDVLAQPGGFRVIHELQGCQNSEQIFNAPLKRVWKNIDLISELRNIETSDVCQAVIADRLAAWDRFRTEKDLAIEQARNTCRFWEIAGKSLTNRLYLVDRRIELESKSVPLKWPTGSRFASHWWMLFNDAFCRSTGVTSELHVYPLKTLWVTQSRGSLRVVTPEETFVLTEQSSEIKHVWFPALAAGVRRSLNRSPGLNVPSHRNASYTFGDRHPKYAKAKYFGRWQDGQMHGMGHLEFPDGRAFNGQMVCGEICGFGRMFTPGIGIYAGEFLAGKYHGFGVLEMKGHATYEGHFRDNLFNGHGVLRTDSYTYIGEFSNGMKCGYGVLDDAIGGDKYMGMFVDDKRSGFGISITMDGNYFEGIFVGDALAGEGVAVFENGSYYEGELTIGGPNGKGTMFLPALEVKSEIVEMDDHNVEMQGNLLTGSLSGKWSDIRVNHGNVTMNQSFTKAPRSLGVLATDYNRKWQSLFNDWEIDVFGAAASSLTHFQLWQKFSTFEANAKRRASLQAEDLSFSADDWANAMPENNANKTKNLDTISVDRLSVHSNHSQRSTRSKVQDLLKRSYESEIDDAHSDKREQYDSNLRTEAPPMLTEIFRQKHDIAEKMLNEHVASMHAADGSSDSSSKQNSSQTVFVPSFGIKSLDKSDLDALKSYLAESFNSDHHPFGVLNTRISFCFYTSYGCWKVKPTPILSGQAMREWESISRKIYIWVRRMFPALPVDGGDIEGELMSHRSLLNPILLSDRVYSTMFVLYASKCSFNDEVYRQRTLACDKKTDEELADFLRIEKNLLPMVQTKQFENAIACLKQVKEKFCPREMLVHIENTFRLIEEAKNESLSDVRNALSADNIMPLTIFLILRAGIPHLGAEIQLMEDLMGGDFEPIMTGFAGYCFVTIKATYQHIVGSKFFQE